MKIFNCPDCPLSDMPEVVLCNICDRKSEYNLEYVLEKLDKIEAFLERANDTIAEKIFNLKGKKNEN